MSETDILAIIVCRFFLYSTLSLGGSFDGDKLSLVGTVDLSTVNITLNRVLRHEAVEQLVDFSILSLSGTVGTRKENLVVAEDHILVGFAHFFATGNSARVLLTLSNFKEGANTEFLGHYTDGSLGDLSMLFFATLIFVLTLSMALVARVGEDDEDEHEAEGYASFPELDDTRANDYKGQEEPDVGPGGENGSCDKHANHLDGLGLINGDDGDG